MARSFSKTPPKVTGEIFMAWQPIIGFDPEAWDWIVQDARAKLAWSAGIRPKVPRAVSQKGWATRRRNLAARKKAKRMYFRQLTKENYLAKREAWRARGWARLHILAAMDPGHWYAPSDIAAMIPGMSSRTVGTKIAGLMKAGHITRVDNPDWRPMSVQARTIAKQGTLEPPYLYGLTEPGLEARSEAQGELERLGRPEYASEQKAPP